ncbi:AAA family ATPase [Sphingomonas sp.]|uniref:chromosome segregation SMC family protein n=1 Tax=Sphingomonas sp. TaxID=28214 RepID=UPI0025F4C825|nr:AAA family ATPase [Sphingomonas sp.]
MQFARVKLTGFKSFVDPVELRILPGLTGVVGPNGCGKSNLLEAIRWAMGEGSAKSLRGAAMDDVIFAGTATRPQRQFAEVSILATRDGDDDIEVVRRIERGSGSAFRINGRNARTRDAQLIFADAATGAHSPALVSQGRIGAVIAAKPAERRAMLEEAAGIAGLHVRRREAEIRLNATEANLARGAELLADMDGRIAQLRRQARSAERYRQLSDDIRQAEARLIYARWRDAAAAADVARAAAKAADEAVRVASEAQNGAAAWVREAATQLGALRGAALTARDGASDARHRLATLEAERAALETRMAALADQRDRMDGDRAREGELARDAGDALTRLAGEIRLLDIRIAEAGGTRPGLISQLDGPEREERAAEIALAQAMAAQARRDAELRVARAALDSAKLAAQRVQADRQRLLAERARLLAVDDVRATLENASAARIATGIAVTEAVTLLERADVARLAASAAATRAGTENARTATMMAALEGEARSLAEGDEAGANALRLLRAAPGYEAALAAALADDLGAEVGATSTALRRWMGADLCADDPVLAGDPLSNYVTAVPELARRLAQIAVAETDDGHDLAVGQRIVTLAGRMRRWDGFVAEGTGGAATEKLKRRNRLAAIGLELPTVRADCDRNDTAMATATATVVSTTMALAGARRGRDDSENAHRAALRAEDMAAAEVDHVVARHGDLDERIDRADEHAQAALAALALAEQAGGALLAAREDGELPRLERLVSDLRKSIATLRARLATLENALAVDTARAVAAVAEADGWRSRSGKAGKRVEEMTRRAAILDEEVAQLADAPSRVAQDLALRDAEARNLALAAEAAITAEREAETALRLREGGATRAAETLAAARESRAGAQARAESQDLRRVELGRVSGERFECPPPVLPERQGFAAASVAAVSDESARLERLTLERERLGPVNLVAETELIEIGIARAQSFDEHAELIEATHRLRGSIGRLNREGRERLRVAFDAVDGHFRKLFATLFEGGEAHLAMIDSDDPLEAGLEILAQPPGKKLTSLTLLSGGEQALTAVALIFALFLTNPAPLCVLDEVDAPLDDANVERFCDLLDTMATDTSTRYLIVTHNAVTMSRMHRLYGVTMIEQGISRLVSVDLGGATALLAAE